MRTSRIERVFRHWQTFGVLTAFAVVVGATTVWSPLVAILIAAAVVLGLAWPLFRRTVRGANWALPLLVALVSTLLFSGLASSSGPARYASTATVLAVVLAMRTRGARTGRALWVYAAVLCVYGLLGTILGRFFIGTENGAFPIVLPMLICLAGWAPDEGNDTDLRLALKMVAFLGSIFALACAVVRLAELSDELSVFSHEKSFLMILAVASAVAARSRWLTVFSLVSVLFAFATYPAATYVVGGLAALLTVVLLRWSPDQPTRMGLGLVGMATVLWATVHVDTLVRFTAPYFALVGKADNGSTRAELYESALRQLSGEPVFAHFFTSDLTLTAKLSGQGFVIPVHNDYLGVALSGGIVAAALLLSVFMSANGCAIQAVKACGISSTRGRAITALLASINAAAVTAFANPVFMSPGSSMAVFAIIFALVSLCVQGS